MRLAAALLALSACSSDPSPVVCTDVLPACSAPPPSYARDVAPVIASACTTCHRDGGLSPARHFDSYAQIFRQRGAVLNQMHSCRMPTSDAPPLAPESRTLVETWLVCGAPDDR